MLTHHTSNCRRDASNGQAYGNFNGSRKRIKDYSYSAIDKIGKGFSSIVYKGLNELTNETVAIKAIDMKGVKDAISREMLDCQIEALKTLNHENVLKCYDVVREATHCYIITQYCDRGDLSGLLKKKRRLSEEQTMIILNDIVAGFVQIGKKGFLHRDLKLANIFLSSQKAKIADFGFAKKFRSSCEKEKYNVGSPLYMSPEALKRNIYSLKNDIWSIGIMTYEMLYGETPWQCKTEKELIDKMARIPVRFRETIKVSQKLKDFIKKCLEVDEKKRMSLEDLSDWIFETNESSSPLVLKKQENLPPSKLNLTHKPVSNIQKLSYQNQMTQRLSSRNQRANVSNKENSNIASERLSGLNTIPKSIVDKNNSIIVNEINTFRLIFKILEKVRKDFPEESVLLNALGSEVLNRVTVLKNCCDTGIDKCFDLGMIEKYLNEKINPSAKKYKSVISEYYKKYTAEIMTESSSCQLDIRREIKRFLQSKLHALKEEDEMLIGYWMVELLNVSKQTSKEKLDSIIDPSIKNFKFKLNPGYIDQRILDLN